MTPTRRRRGHQGCQVGGGRSGQELRQGSVQAFVRPTQREQCDVQGKVGNFEKSRTPAPVRTQRCRGKPAPSCGRGAEQVSWSPWRSFHDVCSGWCGCLTTVTARRAGTMRRRYTNRECPDIAAARPADLAEFGPRTRHPGQHPSWVVGPTRCGPPCRAAGAPARFRASSHCRPGGYVVSAIKRFLDDPRAVAPPARGGEGHTRSAPCDGCDGGPGYHCTGRHGGTDRHGGVQQPTGGQGRRRVSP